MIKLSKLVTDVKTYAKLLNSVGQQGLGPGRRRPLSPVQCAKYIRRLINEENESLDKISERLNLGKPKNAKSKMYKSRDTSQVNMFLNLLKVSDKSRDLVGWSTDEYPYIPFSTVAQLSTFTSEEQDLIIQSILKSDGKKMALSRDDIKEIKKWRNENPDLPIKEGIEKVLKLKAVTVTHVVVVEVHDRLRGFIDSYPDYKEKLLDIFRGHLPGMFHRIDASRSVMAISMDEEAYKVFHEHQYGQDSSFTKFLDDFLENRIE